MSSPARSFKTLEISDPAFEVDGLRHATVYSEALGRRGDCTIWRPPGHDVASGLTLPLVILLHGVYGSHWAWAYNGGAHVVACELIKAGAIPPIALAMPSDGLFRHGSGYLLHDGGDFETWIIDEVPALAAAVVDTVDDSAPLAIGGLSMGGFGALMLGTAHADRVVSIAALSAITEFAQMKLFVGPLDAYSPVPTRQTAAEAFQLCAQPPSLYLACGRDDLLIDANRALHASLQAGGVDHTWVEDPGQHDWAYWRSHIGDALRFMTASLPG